jgi:hypothetical protein
MSKLHPLKVIANAAIKMGWQIVVEDDQKNIRGLIIGTDRYVKNVLKKMSKANPRVKSSTRSVSGSRENDKVKTEVHPR